MSLPAPDSFARSLTRFDGSGALKQFAGVRLGHRIRMTGGPGIRWVGILPDHRFLTGPPAGRSPTMTLCGDVGSFDRWDATAPEGDGPAAVELVQGPFLRALRGIASLRLARVVLRFGGSAHVAIRGDGTIQTFEASSGRMRDRFRSGPVEHMAVSIDGCRVAASLVDRVRVWEARDGRLLRELKFDGAVTSVGLNGDGRRLSVAKRDEASLWDVDTGERVGAFPVRPNRTTAFVNSTHDGALLYACSMAGRAYVWDAAAGETLLELDGVNSLANCPMAVSTAAMVAAAREDGSAEYWDARARERLATLRLIGGGGRRTPDSSGRRRGTPPPRTGGSGRTAPRPSKSSSARRARRRGPSRAPRSVAVTWRRTIRGRW